MLLATPSSILGRGSGYNLIKKTNYGLSIQKPHQNITFLYLVISDLSQWAVCNHLPTAHFPTCLSISVPASDSQKYCSSDYGIYVGELPYRSVAEAKRGMKSAPFFSGNILDDFTVLSYFSYFTPSLPTIQLLLCMGHVTKGLPFQGNWNQLQE